MTTWFVSRHSGAVEWARRQGVEVDRVIPHLQPETVEPGDVVIGSLPVNLAAEVCARGGTYRHLSLRLPPDMRGRELTADELDTLGARIETYHVEKVGL